MNLMHNLGSRLKLLDQTHASSSPQRKCIDIAHDVRSWHERTISDYLPERLRDRDNVTLAGARARLEPPGRFPFGASVWSEERPFIAADSTAMAEPGMVLAFETLYYIKGLGGFIIEDQYLITETGFEVMAPSSRNLIEVGRY